MKGLTRRGFLEAGGAIIALAGLGAAGKALSPGRGLLRPPGGQDEVSFIGACLKCDRCRSVCPTNVIAIAHLEDGILSARTPKLNFKLGYCDFCGKCTEVCPTRALETYQTMTAEFEGAPITRPVSLSIGLAIVDEERCLAWVGGGCTLCSRKCPYSAISLDEQDRPVVDETKCNGCGLCEYICPSLQLRSYLGGNARGIEIAVVTKGGRA